MWEIYLEWCAEIFGVAVRSKLGQLVLFAMALFGLGLFFSMRWGLGAWVLPVVLVAASSMAARRASAARDDLWRRVWSPIVPGVPPTRSDLRGPAGRTVLTLTSLAEAVDAARRGQLGDAEARLQSVDVELLRSEEVELVDAVRAMIAAGAKQELREQEAQEARLGRAVVTEAWNDPARLTALHRAWDRAGVSRGPMSKLHGLVRIRLDAQRIEELPPPEARDLSDEARAIGDDELASELDARARPAAYR